MEEIEKQTKEKIKKSKIRACKYCGSETQVKTRFTNWKNLFRKPTLDEWITLFIILMVILSSYAYRNDINNLNEFYTNESYCDQKIMFEQQEVNLDETQPGEFLNISNLDLDGM